MKSPGATGTRLYLFETSTHVLWAEEVAIEHGIPVEIVPAPRGARNACGLALRTFADAGKTLETLLREEGILFRRHE
jgi:hypothetical protein